MSDLDLTAAVDAAARAMSAHWRDMHTNESLGFQRMLAGHALAAAAPIIEAAAKQAERERIAEFMDRESAPPIWHHAVDIADPNWCERHPEDD